MCQVRTPPFSGSCNGQAGATALEAATVKVPWKAGRVDAMTPDAVTPDGRLPDASKGNDPQKTAAALRNDVFYRMGCAEYTRCVCARADLCLCVGFVPACVIYLSVRVCVSE